MLLNVYSMQNENQGFTQIPATGRRLRETFHLERLGTGVKPKFKN
jgi:hypothetical protein